MDNYELSQEYAEKYCMDLLYEKNTSGSDGTTYVYKVDLPIPYKFTNGYKNVFYTAEINIFKNTFRFDHLYDDNMFATISTGDFGSLDNEKHFVKNMKKFEKVLKKCYGGCGHESKG